MRVRVFIHAILFVLLPSLSLAVNYMCGQDLDGDGYVDLEGETAPCVETPQGWLCPISSVECNSFDTCPLGDYPCTNGICTEQGICSSTLVLVTRYQCPSTGQIYDDPGVCNNNCSQREPCSSNPVYTPATVYAQVKCSYTFWYNFSPTPWWDRYPAVADWCDHIIKVTGTSINTCGYYFPDNTWVCFGDYNLFRSVLGCLGGGIDGVGWCHEWGRRDVSFQTGVEYTCPLGDYTCSGSPPSCTAPQSCVTYDDTVTQYQCSITGTNHDTMDECTSACYRTAGCSTEYTCPAGDYTCMDNNGTYQCSPNECVDLDVTPPTGYDYDDSGYTDDGVIDQDGNCSGEFFIFNGRASQCRGVGTQTTFFNCCSNDSGDFLFFQKGCTDEEWQTNSARDEGRCHYIGDYCKEDWPVIGCVQRAKVYCCFNSKLARIVHEQGRPQLKSFGPDGGWGSPESPECRGFRPEEFQMLDFSRIDLSEYFGDIVTPPAGDVTRDMEERINEFYQGIQ